MAKPRAGSVNAAAPVAPAVRATPVAKRRRDTVSPSNAPTMMCSRMGVMQHIAPERSPAELIALVDEVIAAYVTWRTACSALRTLYGVWSTCDRRHRNAAFGVYVAALDREERAATSYRSVVEQITTLQIELRGRSPRPDLTALPGSAGIVSWSARSIAQRLGL
jgi:hypothetical protein